MSSLTRVLECPAQKKVSNSIFCKLSGSMLEWIWRAPRDTLTNYAKSFLLIFLKENKFTKIVFIEFKATWAFLQLNIECHCWRINKYFHIREHTYISDFFFFFFFFQHITHLFNYAHYKNTNSLAKALYRYFEKLGEFCY
jgi:hypothetical protein